MTKHIEMRDEGSGDTTHPPVLPGRVWGAGLASNREGADLGYGDEELEEWFPGELRVWGDLRQRHEKL